MAQPIITNQRLEDIDSQVRKLVDVYTGFINKELKTKEEASYATTVLAGQALRMLWITLHKNMCQQEAKATLKTIIDGYLLEQGVSLKIHEFE